MRTEINKFVGFDYGIRRVAWGSLVVDGDSFTLSTNELSLPKYDCGLCQFAELSDYVYDNLSQHIDAQTLVAIEAPITGGSGNAQTAAHMAMSAGVIFDVTSKLTNHHLLAHIGSWKKMVLGNGKASKGEVKEQMIMRWGSDLITSQDVADATAIAMYAHLTWIGSKGGHPF